MPIPRIAIVGRPNVGKSSLLNMIAREKVSIVDASAGTTRDRVTVVAELDPPLRGRGEVKVVEIVDTGGFGAYVAEGERYNEVGADLAALAEKIEFQIAEAVSKADVILFAVDAQAGITPQDQEIARLLREQRLGERSREGGLVPIRVVATKVDGPKWEPHAHELAALGFDEPIMVSAKNNYMRRDFLDELWELTPEVAPGEAGEAAGGPADMKLAIIGKRNAGKSTLVNAMAGEERVIVSEIAGTTRDAVDVRFELGGRSLLAIDTAGLRKKKSFANQIEWWAYDRAKRSIDRADVVLMLIDATEPVSQVDEQLAMLTQRAYKPVVIVVNKWDLAEGRRGRHGRPVTTEDYEKYLRKELRGIDYAPIVFMSAKTGRNIRGVVRVAFELLEQARTRVGTGRLNRLVQGIVERQGPPSKIGHRAKVYYVAQVAVEPPTVVLVVNKPELFTPNYLRFLLNRFREQLPYPEVPIKIIVRPRKQAREGERGLEMTGEEIAEAERLSPEEAGAELPDEMLDALPEDAEAYFEEEP